MNRLSSDGTSLLKKGASRAPGAGILDIAGIRIVRGLVKIFGLSGSRGLGATNTGLGSGVSVGVPARNEFLVVLGLVCDGPARFLAK
jgi:hypothetical protein